MTGDKTFSQDRLEALQETLVAIFELGVDVETSVKAVLVKVAPEEVAAALGDFDEWQKLVMFRALPSREAQAVVLEETDQESNREIMEVLTEQEREDILGAMPVDDLVDQLEMLSAPEQQRIIESLEREDAKDVRELLRYAPDTAGGMMTTEFISIPSGTTSRDALAKIQGNLNVEVLSYVYVTEDGDFLRGVVSIRDLLRAPPAAVVDTYMEKDLVKVGVDTDREEVAAVFDKYDLAAVPVVDAGGCIRGIVTFDDVIDAIREEHSEDMLRLAGTTAVHPLYESLSLDVIKRLPFLVVTMAGGLVVAGILDSLGARVLGLAMFAKMVIWVHLVSALSGNVAVVTSTVLVRGLATGDVVLARLKRVLWRQLQVTVLLAVVLALLAALEMYVFGLVTKEPGYSTWSVIATLMAALCICLTWAGFVGTLIPVGCHLTGKIDPALASGPFVTVTCDISSSFIFLVIICWFLGSSWPGS